MSTAPLTARAARAAFACSACGAVVQKWLGQCPGCGEWNTMTEEAVAATPRRRPNAAVDPVVLATLTGLDGALGARARRQPTGIGECDRVLGGGIVPGSLILLGGDPGIGKSTLALDLAHRVGTLSSPSVYCAGEESAAQVAMRATRTGCAGPGVVVAAETDLDVLIATIDARRPPLAVIDSIQTVDDQGCAGAPGSVNQVRGAAARLLSLAKSSDVPIVLVGHVTKEGAIAGPRTLEHMVDVVLYLEGERHGDHRLLRGVKNRFGSTDDIGILVLDDAGIRESDAPGRAFLDEASLGIPGSALTVVCEGSRPIAVEIQALAVKSDFPQPRRTASGFDLPRLHVLLAILEKRAKVRLASSDVYLNAVGGVRIGEPAADLAAALALAGAATDRVLPPGCVVVGEVGLGGEVRRVRRTEQRLIEAAALGMQAAILPAAHTSVSPTGLRCHHVGTLAEAVRLLV